MTGHQNTREPEGTSTARLRHPGGKVLEVIGVTDIAEVDTYNQKALTAAWRRPWTAPAQCVIARHPCKLKFARSRGEAWIQAQHVSVDSGRCTLPGSASNGSAALLSGGARDGRVTVNDDLCIGDGSCIRPARRTPWFRGPGRRVPDEHLHHRRGGTGNRLLSEALLRALSRREWRFVEWTPTDWPSGRRGCLPDQNRSREYSPLYNPPMRRSGSGTERHEALRAVNGYLRTGAPWLLRACGSPSR
jgi:hypothetical protein